MRWLVPQSATGLQGLSCSCKNLYVIVRIPTLLRGEMPRADFTPRGHSSLDRDETTCENGSSHQLPQPSRPREIG